MAKVSAPLMSFSARGAIANALVFFPWKGINAVRQYVIPANPDSDLQKVQRGYFRLAVADWHLAKYTATDKAAWNRYAGYLADVMSGFNAFVRSYLTLARLALTEVNPPYATGIVSGGAGDFDAYLEEDGHATSAFVRWGYSPTALHTQVAMNEEVPDNWVARNQAATVGERIWLRMFTNDGADVQGWSGLFYFDMV